MTNWRGKSLWSVSSRFAGAGLAFVLNVLLARALSQDDLGHFFLSLSIAWGGALVCQWGASILAVKWVATARAQGDEFAVRSAVWSLVAFTLAQGSFVTVCLMFVDRPVETKLIWAGWAFAVSLQNLMPEILRGFDDLKWASLLSGPVPQLFAVLTVGAAWMLLTKLSFEQAALLVILANLACSIAGLVLVATRAPFTWRLMNYRSFLNETTPIAFSLAATYLLVQADLWICGMLLPKSEVAVYGIAQRFVAFVSMPMMIFGSVVTPTLTELLAKNDRVRLQSVLSRGTFVTSVFALLVLFGGAALGLPIMRMLFGETYAAAYPLFLILGAGQVIHAIAGPNGYLLLLSGEQKSAMVATLTAAATLAVSGWLGGLMWGAEGVAMGSSFALTVQTIWMWLMVRRRLKMSPHFRWATNWSQS